MLHVARNPSVGVSANHEQAKPKTAAIRIARSTAAGTIHGMIKMPAVN
jgi:hypothetical protein